MKNNVKRNTTIFAYGFLLLSIAEFIVADKPINCVLLTDAIRNLFCSWVFFMSLWRAKAKKDSGLIKITSHFVTFFFFLACLIIGGCSFSFTWWYSPMLDKPSTINALIIVAISLILNTVSIFTDNPNGKLSRKRIFDFDIIAPSLILITVGVVLLTGNEYASNILGIVICVVLIFRTVQFSEQFDPSAHTEKKAKYKPLYTDAKSEKKFWEEKFGEKEVERWINSNTDKIDNEKMLRSLYGDSVVDEMKANTKNNTHD